MILSSSSGQDLRERVKTPEVERVKIPEETLDHWKRRRFNSLVERALRRLDRFALVFQALLASAHLQA